MSKRNRTARHVACNVFRYPHRPPRLWHPASPYLLHPCSRARQATRRATPCQPERAVASMSAGERVGATPADASVAEWLLLRARKANTALLALRDLPPIPLKGALNRASNIMLEIMRSSQVAHSLVPRSAQLVYCALRRIIYIMCKCPAATPLRSTAVRCAAHVRLCLAPLRAPAKAGLDYPPSHVSVPSRLQPAQKPRCLALRPGPATPQCNGSVERSLPAHAGRLAPCSNRQGQALRVLRSFLTAQP